MKKKIIISGYGKVAKEILKLLKEYRVLFTKKYNIEFIVVAVIGSKFLLYQEEGIDIDDLSLYGLGSSSLENYAKNKRIKSKTLNDIKGGLLIESTPTDINTGEPGYSYIKWAIKNKMDVVSLSKGALVKYFDEIMEMKIESNSQIKYSGATMAALPSMDVGLYSLSSTKIDRIEGILNGTSNYILTEMYNKEENFDQIIKRSQEEGIAEKNIDYDIKGIDTANKLYILTKSLLTSTMNYKSIKIEGIENISIEKIREEKRKGNKIKLIGIADDEGIEVRPMEISQSNPLYYVDGKEKGIVYYTKDMGKIVVSGGESSPKGAASSAIKDMINIYR
ncbi:homoserine dehydrogenase [Clostridium sp. D2Q-11]|uniref:Homoserine dehydrogenase n=1 Tax=Anaeromonas frigoriresistens TaxID=2683708 RepID=A0A942Z7N5_9FIRM|nr:homoserine dehydrogenase [Anaeromonas frigoriresistens]MBS4537140.1 homoserine dehydrogenase [Anaeromonas frigoriresistens]